MPHSWPSNQYERQRYKEVGKKQNNFMFSFVL